MTDEQKNRGRRRLIAKAYQLFKKTQRYMPPLVRGFAGILLILAGFVGFLPILGFWMIPLGLAVLATDIPPLKRWLLSKIQLKRK
jgi:hypothetical protein